MVHQIIVVNSHSLQANTCSELYPHLLVYSECVQAHSLTHNTAGVYTHTHTQMHTHTYTKFESQHAEVNKDPGIARWCMQCVCDYSFGVLIYDVALRVSPHVCLSMRICVGD